MHSADTKVSQEQSTGKQKKPGLRLDADNKNNCCVCCSDDAVPSAYRAQTRDAGPAAAAAAVCAGADSAY